MSELVDTSNCRISPHSDGPLIVRGRFRILGEDGSEVELRRRTVALCRCGKSRLAPFCDGTHATIGFQAGARWDQPTG